MAKKLFERKQASLDATEESLPKKFLPLVTILIALLGGVPGTINIHRYFFDKPQPIFSIRMTSDGTYVPPAGTSERGFKFFLMYASIANKSEVSLQPLGYSFAVKSLDGWIPLKPIILKQKMSIESDQIKEMDFDPIKNDITQMVRTITRENPVVGYAIFLVDESIQKTLHRKNREMKLIVGDVFGNRYEATDELTGVGGPMIQDSTYDTLIPGSGIVLKRKNK